MKSGGGFTITELLVSLFVFSLVVIGAGGLLVSGMGVQRRSGTQQELIDQASFLAEYMSRALRQAKKELAQPPVDCLTDAGRGANYEMNPTADLIRFLNRSNKCQQFFRSENQIFEQLSTDSSAANLGAPLPLTADDIVAQALYFALSGESQEDNLQPKVTFVMELRGKAQQGGFQPTVNMQTTVSQRKIDVQE